MDGGSQDCLFSRMKETIDCKKRRGNDGKSMWESSCIDGLINRLVQSSSLLGCGNNIKIFDFFMEYENRVGG